MTQEHFRARAAHTNSVDPDQARASIEWLAGEADMVVPGPRQRPNIRGT
jgi:hypothetical protein